MNSILRTLPLLLSLLAPAPALAATPATDNAGLVELRAVGMQFQGPAEIASGWTTFRLHNTSAMTHFAMIDVPPTDIDLQQFSAQLMLPFQEAMDAMNAADAAALDAAYASFPPWLGELGRAGGPGLLSPGLTGQTTVYLAPGRYVLECYVKKDGVFHTTPSADGQLGMLLEFTVSEAANGAAEPRADAVFKLSNDGIALVEGALRAGTNTLRINVVEQQTLPSFVGNDIHLLRVSGTDDLARAAAWMDWRSSDGLQDPSPVAFLGGIQDMPAGSHGYFTVELSPGDYALMAEVPDPLGAGLVLPFTVE